MTRKRSIPRRVIDRFRRAFALPLVILLMLISSMTIVVIMQRQTAQSRLVDEMITDYHTHHAAFGVRAIVRKWLSAHHSELTDYAAKDGAGYRFILPNEVFVTIWILDGQGVPVSGPTDLGAANLEYYRDVSRRVRDRRALRPAGPSAISLASAPPDVLAALVEDQDVGARAAQRITQARQARPLDRDIMMNQLRRAGVSDEDIARIIAISTFSPSLWRVNVMAENRRNRSERYFVMRADVTGQSVRVTSWEELVGVDPADPFAEKLPTPDPDDADEDDLDDLDDDEDDRDQNDEDDDEEDDDDR